MRAALIVTAPSKRLLASVRVMSAREPEGPALRVVVPLTTRAPEALSVEPVVMVTLPVLLRLARVSVSLSVRLRAPVRRLRRSKSLVLLVRVTEARLPLLASVSMVVRAVPSVLVTDQAPLWVTAPPAVSRDSGPETLVLPRLRAPERTARLAEPAVRLLTLVVPDPPTNSTLARPLPALSVVMVVASITRSSLLVPMAAAVMLTLALVLMLAVSAPEPRTLASPSRRAPVVLIVMVLVESMRLRTMSPPVALRLTAPSVSIRLPAPISIAPLVAVSEMAALVRDTRLAPAATVTLSEDRVTVPLAEISPATTRWSTLVRVMLPVA